jgi:hypothetical protein
VRTSDIYWGAIPFVAIQIIMVALVLSFPGLVGAQPEGGGSRTPEIHTEDAGAGYLLPPENRP